MATLLPHLPRQATVSRLNWRVTLVQFLANAVVIGVLILLLPGFELHARHELLAVLWLAAVFGVLSALVRPALEFLLLPYLLQSLGLVVVVINAVLLALLGLTSTLEIKRFGALVVGAVLAGVVGFFLESVLGLTPPVFDDASARAEGRERAVRIARVSERLRLMQLYGILSQYIVDLAFDWAPLRGFRRRMQEWLWRPPVPIEPLPPHVKVRLLLQDLGPTYVKLGQIVSSQGRALPMAWEQELTKLQSDVRPFAYDDVRGIISESLGAPPETLYESFDPTPLAAASLAQVHEATTHDGRRVAVKVQRPNIHEQLRSDIRILTRGAALLERRARWADDADLTGVVTEFGTTLLRELDYVIEAYNARRLERVLAPIENVHVPAVESALSSDRVLTLEFVEGVKSTDTRAIDAAGLDRQELARSLVRGAVQMVMIEGFFHADPHPGNVVVELANGRLTFLDTGMVGQLDLRKRISFAEFLLAFRDKDVAALAATLRSLSKPFRTPDESDYQRQFEQRIGPLIDPAPGHSAPLQRLVSEALDVLRGAGYRLDSQLTLAVKAVAQAEAITSALVPEADASEFAKLGGAALEELVPEAVNPDAILKAARRQAILTAGEVAQHLPSLQDAARTWLDQIQRGQIPVRVRLAMAEFPPLRIELLGRFRVTAGTHVLPAEAWRRSKAAGLVKVLALAPGHRLHRERVMDVLWPELAPPAAAANLRKAVHYARRAVDAEGSGLIASVGDVLLLPSERLRVDVDAWRNLASQARRSGKPSVYAEAVELYGDGLLPDDRYEEWTIVYRDELQTEFVSLLEELAGLLEARGEIEGAIRAAGRLVAVEPLREEGHLLLIRLHALSGRRGESLRRYEQLRELLEVELGVEPSAEAQRLYEEVRAGQTAEPELTAELWERVGELRVVAGDTVGAVKAFSLALDVADAPAVAGRLHRRAAQTLLMQHDAEQAEPHLQAAETVSVDPAERARLVCLRAHEAWVRGDLDRAQALAEWARELAESVGDPDDLAAAQEALAIVSHVRGDWRRGLEFEIERVHGDGEGSAPLARVFDIHHCIGQYHLYGDGLSDGVEDYARRVLALAERSEAVHAQAFAWCLLGESLLLQARWDEAAGCLERSCDLHASLGTRSGALPWQRLAELAACRGAPEEAESMLRRASAIATVSPMARHLWGRIYATAALGQIEQGDAEAAARSVRAAGAAAARYGDCPSCSALLNPVAAEALTMLDDRDGARPYAEAATSVAGIFDSSAWRAMAESAAASVAAADGDVVRARERFEAAAALYERAGQPYWLQRSQALAAAT